MFNWLFGNKAENKGRGITKADNFAYPEGYSVVENGWGNFQVWKGNQVIRPDNLELLSDFQSVHDFMFVRSLDRAQRLIVRHVHTQKCNEPVRVYGNE